MPEMNGINSSRNAKSDFDILVIILSSIAKEGAKVTMECLIRQAISSPSPRFGIRDLHTVACPACRDAAGVADSTAEENAGTARRIPEELRKATNRGSSTRKPAIISAKPARAFIRSAGPVPSGYCGRQGCSPASWRGETGAGAQPGPIEIIAIGTFHRRTERPPRSIAKIDPNLEAADSRRPAHAGRLYGGSRTV